MNPERRAIVGEKAMFDNLARINAILTTSSSMILTYG